MIVPIIIAYLLAGAVSTFITAKVLDTSTINEDPGIFIMSFILWPFFLIIGVTIAIIAIPLIIACWANKHK